MTMYWCISQEKSRISSQTFPSTTILMKLIKAKKYFMAIVSVWHILNRNKTSTKDGLEWFKQAVDLWCPGDIGWPGTGDIGHLPTSILGSEIYRDWSLSGRLY